MDNDPKGFNIVVYRGTQKFFSAENQKMNMLHLKKNSAKFVFEII